jgi:tetratricopeptide (TPR) repeat protein
MSCVSVYGQAVSVDSLKLYLKNNKSDTSQINALNALSHAYIDLSQYENAMKYAQQAITQAEKIHYKKGFSLAYDNIGLAFEIQGDYQKAYDNYFKALKINEEIGNKKAISTSFNNLGIIDYYQSNYADALDHYLRALKINNELGDKIEIAKSYGNIGLIYEQQGDYPKALEQFFNALKIQETLHDTTGIEFSLNSIGNIYSNLNEFDKALEYEFKALKLNENSRNIHNISECYNNIGTIYSNKKNYPKALEYYFKSLKIDEQHDDKLGISILLNNIANIYNYQNDDSKALEFNLKSLKIKEEIDDKKGISYSYINIGKIYQKQKNYPRTIQYAEKALAISKSIGAKRQILRSFQMLSETLEAQGKGMQSLDAYKQFILYRDSLYNEENTKKSVRTEMNFEFDKKQAEEKAQQEKKDVLANEELKRQKLQRNYFIFAFGLMLLLALFIFRSYRQKQKANEMIEHQKKEVELQKELVEEKNKEITDSITYAKRLQQAILPPSKFINQYLPENFVFYKPKDIVAGDFYWMEVVQFENENKKEYTEGSKPSNNQLIFIAAADCTGHGVPGAMVSVVCSNALNRAVKEFGITETGKILDKVRELVIETFEKSESEVKDGMDISLCSINRQTFEMQWSGANNPLWLIKNGRSTITEIKADKQAIGKTDEPHPFESHKLQLEKGDQFYLFTDGYADQFGGEKGKKFKYKQLQNLLLANDQKNMNDQKIVIEEAFDEWKSNLEQVDDILIIGIKI